MSEPCSTISFTGASRLGMWIGCSRRFIRSRVAKIMSDVLSFGSSPHPYVHVYLLLDVVLMPDIAQVEPDLSELLDFGRCKACRVA